jgi:hypothetical protein
MPDFRFAHIVPAARSAEWSRVRGCTWVGLAIFLVFFSPFLVEGTVVALALAFLVPLALGLGLIEHFVPSVWLLVVLFIHVAGLADLVSDFNLLGKTLVAYFTGSWVDDVSDETQEERNILLARVLMTLTGAIPVILFLAFGMSATSRLADDLHGRSSSGSSDSSPSFGSNGVALVIMALVWKIVMVCLRLFLLFRVTKDIISTGHIHKESRTAIELTELFLLADLLWSGIPLGVLTFLELFLYGEGFTVRQSFPTKWRCRCLTGHTQRRETQCRYSS